MTKWDRIRTIGNTGGTAEPRQVRYFAFLSYSHDDEATAQWLHGALERFRVPPTLAGRLTEHGVVPRRLRPIFRDRQALAASGELSASISAALRSARFLVVLCSRAAAKSRWTNAEIDMFKRHRPDGCVLAVIIDGEPFASETQGREDDECLPPALRVRYDRRGRPTPKRSEPLAADLREDRDGKRLGLLKIVAGMLGVGLDDLVQRDTLRRQRRLAIVAAASLAGMVVTSGLAVTALTARDAARDQRREAESLVAFMLGDLRSKLEPVGRLDALDGVGARVLAYYRQQDQSELSDAALGQRSRALSLMGEIAYLRGDVAGALRLYREAMAGTGEAVERAPSDPERLFNHAQNVFWVGEIARMRGQPERAEAASREYKRLAERMVAIDPDDMKWRMEVQYAAANLGIVLLGQRRFGEAGAQFEQALKTIQSLAVADPGNPDYQKSLSESLAWLADARAAEGRLGDAIALRERQVALLDRLIGSGNGDVAYRQKAIPAHQALGRLLAARGAIGPGIAHLRTAVDHADRLIPTEPANTKWQEFAASARLALGEHLLAASNRAEAGEQVRRGCEIVERLVARDRNVIDWAETQRNCLTMRAELALADGSYGQAAAAAESALRVTRETSASRSDAYAVARLHRLAGDAQQRLANLPGAQSHWTRGLAVLPAGVAERPSEMGERARLLERLGQKQRASITRRKLDALGYRA